tara:strand:+ start:385 stop:519 length:135 start_codon:yes stop_codon:yes gene_type:complete
MKPFVVTDADEKYKTEAYKRWLKGMKGYTRASKFKRDPKTEANA